ncbi:MAG: hypothetical protein AAF194_06885 [Pseudomonadota bacterium]
MITLRKRLAAPRSHRMLVPAFIFLACATFSAVGGSAAALWLMPAGFVLDATRGNERTS